MSLITMFPEILEAGRTEYEELKAGVFHTSEETSTEKSDWKNILANGDNGAFMKALLHDGEFTGKLQMVYIDPPFFSKANYDASVHISQPSGSHEKDFTVKHRAYGDTWSEGIGQYLSMLAGRLYMIRDLLREDGTVWVHLDWHAVHYVRILMDEIFGPEHFVNEIIWTYKSGGSGKKYFARKHDTILVYSKNKDYYFTPLKEKSYNRGFKPYHFKGVEEFRDEIGWYTMVNMKDVWQIDMVGRTSAERTGYATQKPEALLERILACSTREGDLCADFFCGSGTLAAAAQKMNRRWICCDQSKLAVSTAYRRVLEVRSEASCGFRLLRQEGMFEDSVSRDTLTLSLQGGKLRLENCGINLCGLNLDREDLDAVAELSEREPLQLIEYWTADDAYDGSVHRARHVLMRNKGKLQTEINLGPEFSEKEHPTVSVKAADVFGNRYNAVMRDDI